ncbi:MAG: endonuclease/exonuclease/phosphatase family protein [Proteobacteria bacterium]|nr:endonuclease/exonuclease/phosphatase family protein [Pseudomonadota bacterium]
MRSPIVAATLRGLAIGYPVALLIFIVSLRLVGERWWGTTIALYLPRFPFAAPLLPLIAAIVWIGPRRLLWAQLVAFGLLLFLTGFRVAWPTPPTPGAQHLRIVSCNINAGALSVKRIMKPLLARDPDIIVLQEVSGDSYAALRKLVPGYTVQETGQFWLASRFPVAAVSAPRTEINGLPSMPFVQYRIMTPAGPITLFNVHPLSPRDGLESVRGDGIRHQFLRGDLFNTRAREVVAQNTAFRLAQLRAYAERAHQATGPVIIAGDTNLPELSWAFERWLGDFSDGFAQAGSGFGYSYPSPRDPWMRIDRIMADGRYVRFRSFEVLNHYISDHYAITSELELVP